MSEMSDAGLPQPPHSARAAGPPAVRIARRRLAQPNGWWGMALFLCSETVIFGTLMSSYFYLDFRSTHWPPAGITPPEVIVPAIATGVLVGTSILMWLAVRAVRNALRWRAVQLIGVATLSQLLYLATQILLFRHDLNDFHPQGSAYGSIYFTLLAAHHAHVLLGILLDLTVMWKLTTSGPDNYWVIGVRGLALYWYVVCALAVPVLFTIISPAL